MEESIRHMIHEGISYFCDFREEGIHGVNQIKKALKKKKISSIILSRPQKMEYDKEELEILLENSDGIGVSSVSDWEVSELQKIAKHVKQRKKMFALHGSEAMREDIDRILDTKPDFLVHMVSASEADLLRVRDEQIPIVICPRSNAFFKLKPNITMMKKVGITLLLGTDNAMLHAPSIVAELRFLKRSHNGFSNEELLQMITYSPRKALNLDCDILVPNSPSNFIVLDKESLEPIFISACKQEG
jgi:cytosine/adenosine deaminase-related metal-dependent hydrolase